MKRVILCSGKVYYDLLNYREAEGITNAAIIRVEQLYPLHHDEIVQVLEKYKEVKEYYWVQEEPHNMGAYGYIDPLLSKLLPGKKELQYIGRSSSAATATGSHTRHEKEHEQLMNKAFE